MVQLTAKGRGIKGALKEGKYKGIPMCFCRKLVIQFYVAIVAIGCTNVALV